MMEPPDEPDRQIADGVLPEQIDDLAVPVRLNVLLPWHKPRKQLVREEQWLYFSRRLIERERGEHGLPNPPGGNPEVRYLTLPGIDYLDVRQLADVCRDLGCRLTSTGFQSGDESNPKVARAQVREQSLIAAGHITAHSHTFAGRLEEITHTNSQSYRDLKRRGPFHIVNIDACGSIAAPGADHAHRLIDAVYKTVEIQLETMTGGWLLFVTADARPDSVAGETLDRLCDAIFGNAQANENFRDRAVPLLDPEELDIRVAARRASERAGDAFVRLFSLGLAKWLLSLARVRNWDMKTHHPFCYSTMPRDDETPSMACLAFEFLPPPPGLLDRFGVARAQPALGGEREDTSVRAVEKIRGMANADFRMRRDEPLRTRMSDNLRRLLEEAGYEAEVLDGIGA